MLNCCVYRSKARCLVRLFHISTLLNSKPNKLNSRPNRNMLAHLQILGTGSSEVSPTVFLFTETNRYLFNCSEGLQTISCEHSVKYSKLLRNVFLTRLNWENVGGLPGLCMSLNDSERNREKEKRAKDKEVYTGVSVFGPTGLHEFRSASEAFINNEYSKIKVHTCPDIHSPLVYNDDDIKVEGYEIFSGENSSTEPSQRKPLDDDFCEPPEAKQPCLSKDHIGSIVFYICQLSKSRGKFHPDKAIQLGLKPGRLYKELGLGNSVVAPNGRTIFPHEVIDPDQPGPSFVVVECPLIEFVSHIVKHPRLQPDAVNPTFVVHIAPRVVSSNPEYRDWLGKFGPNVQNVFVHQEICEPEILMRSCYKLQLPLNLIGSDFFHLPMVPYSKPSPALEPATRPSDIVGRSLMKLHLKPLAKRGSVENNLLQPFSEFIDDTIKDIKKNVDLIKKIETLPHLKDKFAALSSSVVAQEHKKPLPKESSITFLGTGSAVPSKYRSLSSILVHLPSGYMFLDCGEGTLSQLYKCFGEERANRILCNLKCIFVSHIHGDHHLGLIRIINRRAKLLGRNNSPLVIIGPNLLRQWLEDYRRSCERLWFWFQNSKGFMQDAHCGAVLHSSAQELGFARVSTVPVIHTKQSFGIVLEHSEGWKLVYSGDTRPCHALVAAGQGATLLVHEATFDDSLQSEAISKRHSTLTEAVQVSQEMKAKLMICTHFSQRYPKFSTAMLSDLSSRVAVAFDFMTVPIMKAQELHNLQPCIDEVFSVLVDDYKEGLENYDDQ